MSGRPSLRGDGRCVRRGKPAAELREEIRLYCLAEMAAGRYPTTHKIQRAVNADIQRVCALRSALIESGELALVVRRGGEGTTHSRQRANAVEPAPAPAPKIKRELTAWEQMAREHFARERRIGLGRAV